MRPACRAALSRLAQAPAAGSTLPPTLAPTLLPRLSRNYSSSAASRPHGRPRPGARPADARLLVQQQHHRHQQGAQSRTRPPPRAPPSQPRDIGRLYDAVVYRDAVRGGPPYAFAVLPRPAASAGAVASILLEPPVAPMDATDKDRGRRMDTLRHAVDRNEPFVGEQSFLDADDLTSPSLVDDPGNLVAEETAYRDQLRELRSAADADGMLRVINEMEQRGREPSLWAFLVTLRACSRHGDLRAAEDILQKMLSARDTNRRARFIAAARTSVAALHAANRCPEKVLAVMGWSDELAVADLDGLVEQLNFGRDTYAWGLIMLALNQLESPQTALEVLDRLTARGITVTDSLCHVAIEAYNALGRPEDAERMFQDLLDRGLVPNERTIGSLLRVLTSAGPARRSRPSADPARIQNLVALVSQPSPRFLTSSLVAYTNVGYVDGAERCFEALAQHCEGNVPDERAFMILMRCYASQIIGEVPPNTPESQISNWYRDCVRRADELWSRYLAAYGSHAPGPDQAYARQTIFPKYVLIKSLGLELNSALQLLREALEPETIALRSYFKPGTLHFAALFSGIERACDAHVLEDALEVMSRAGIPLNDACLSSAICTLVFHGSPAHAAKLTAACAPVIIDMPAEQVVIRNRSRLLRRLKLLEDALEQGPLAQTQEWVKHRSMLKEVVSKLTGTLRDTS